MNDMPENMIARAVGGGARATLIYGPDPDRLGELRYEVGLAFNGRLATIALYSTREAATTAFCRASEAMKGAGFFASATDRYVAMRAAIASTTGRIEDL